MTDEQFIYNIISGNFDENINHLKNLRALNVKTCNGLDYLENVMSTEISLLGFAKNYVLGNKELIKHFSDCFDFGEGESVLTHLDDISILGEKIVTDFMLELENDLDDCFWEDCNLTLDFKGLWLDCVNKFK